MTEERKANQPVNVESSDDDIRDRAREQVDGGDDVEIDAEVKRYEAGAYVQVWVWVAFEEEGEA